MISIEEIERTILELEERDTTYATCEKLAWLYTVRDHLKGEGSKLASEEPRAVLYDNNTGDSDFLKTVNGKSSRKVFEVMDELMESMKILQPRIYNSIMSKLAEA